MDEPSGEEGETMSTGTQLKLEGQTTATYGTPFVIRFAVDAGIKLVAERQAEFTSEDVRRVLGHLAESPNVSRVIGARMTAAARRGEIVSDGRTVAAARKEAHARRLLLWKAV
jgi:HJR/Mrr/RecB family endonuclease